MVSFAEEDFSYKLDKALTEKISNLSDDEKIPVSIWVEDIDHNEVKAQALNQIKNKVSTDTFAIAKAVDNGSELMRLNSKEIKKSLKKQKADSEEIQEYILAERSISAKKYLDKNKEIVEKVISKENKNVDYICKYAPNINMSLTKAEINDIIKSERIDKVYYAEKLEVETPEIDEEALSDIRSISTPFYNVTGLSTVRDAFGYSGEGMKVGLLECDRPIASMVTDRTIYGTNDPYPNSTGQIHPTITSKLMVGHVDGYVGAIPDADLYYAMFNSNNSEVKSAAESLLSSGVTAINCSFGLFPENYNVYGDFSRWFDHIALEHSVHMVFSSGNDGSTGVRSSNMTCNSIVVGNCSNDGEIDSTSSYNTLTTRPYKPDLVAPGTGGNILTIGPSHLPATSFSAPLVTSAVIQMAEVSAVLKTNPRLMKAVLLSSSKITSYMNNEPVFSQLNGNAIALSQPYGSGMLSVTNAFVAFHDKSYYISSTLSSATNTSTTSKTIYGLNKKVRVSLCWDKKVQTPADGSTSGDHLGNAANISLDKLKLTVITPSGNVYNSAYTYDNKQMVTITNGELGTYQFVVTRLSTNPTTVNYSIGISTQ